MFIDNEIFINNFKNTKLNMNMVILQVMNQQNKLYKILLNQIN